MLITGSGFDPKTWFGFLLATSLLAQLGLGRLQRIRLRKRVAPRRVLGGAAMRDLRKDWVRWTKAERISAVVIVAALTVGTPSLLASSVSASLAHSANQITRSP